MLNNIHQRDQLYLKFLNCRVFLRHITLVDNYMLILFSTELNRFLQILRERVLNSAIITETACDTATSSISIPINNSIVYDRASLWMSEPCEHPRSAILVTLYS